MDKRKKEWENEADYTGVHGTYPGVHGLYEGVHDQYKGVHTEGETDSNQVPEEAQVAPGMDD